MMIKLFEFMKQMEMYIILSRHAHYMTASKGLSTLGYFTMPPVIIWDPAFIWLQSFIWENTVI